MKRFLYETLVVAVGLTAYYWLRLTGRSERARDTWADVESELCGETNEQRRDQRTSPPRSSRSQKRKMALPDTL